MKVLDRIAQYKYTFSKGLSRPYNSFDCWHSARLIPPRDRKEDGAARIAANQRRRGRFAIRDSDPCMRNALMGNTCYVVATVTIADWRMTVGFRALLMAVCRRPSPSCSLIPDTGSPIWVHAFRHFGIGCPPFSAAQRPTSAPPNYLRNLVFRALISSITARDADRRRDFILGAHREDRSRLRYTFPI